MKILVTGATGYVGGRLVPVLLKRGPSATIEEWLLAAEYVMAQGKQTRDPVRTRHPHF